MQCQTDVLTDDEKLARQMFVIGCFGLPWLWILNCAYFFSDIREDRASPALRKCDIDDMNDHEAYYVLLGYFMSLAGGVISVTALFTWIITFQLSWRDWEGSKSYMIYVPEEDRNECRAEVTEPRGHLGQRCIRYRGARYRERQRYSSRMDKKYMLELAGR